ncbi:hypothetical protein [Acinetobacter tibetensis]|uniref:Uncharacterized protein n=1 Tax=Acinetobacter tibetensis TaxID=2943497 RepID=A0AAE9S1B0_9GAMM|nr:hypothetical protein [Acinetobacter tibetensis]USE84079.1 hypothetical protein M5E07_04450 [Acinetobacter tibetensis]
MKDRKIIGYTLIALFLLSIIFILNKNKHEEFKISLINDSLVINFPNKIFVKNYAIKDFEKDNFSNSNGPKEYRKVLENSYYKEVDHIKIENISKYNIIPDHAYFYVMTQENDHDLNASLKSLGFCIKGNNVLLQNSREEDSAFIEKCHAKYK